MAPFHPRATAEVRVGEVVLGWMGELHPRVASELALPPGVFAFELEYARWSDWRRSPRSSSPSRASRRCCATWRWWSRRRCRRRRSAGVIQEVGGPLVEEARVFDVYTGPPLPEGQKNLAFALRYRAPDRTLRDDEVQAAHTRIVEEVQRRLGGQLRSG